MKTVIMAGGKGTRIASVNAEVPKPMIPILGKPILEYQLECLRRQGYDDIILVVGHLGHVIQDYFGDGSGNSPATGEPFGVKIQYVVETEPLGTAGALFLLKDQLDGDFLLLCGDVIFDIDVNRFYQFHKERGGVATLFTHPNSHPYDSGIIMADESGMVTNWLHKEDPRTWYRNRVNAGLHFFSGEIFHQGLFQELKKVDLDREVLKPLIPTGQLFVYDSPEYVKDMGTPDRFYSVTEDIRSGKVRSKNLGNPQKCVFLDRDGTLNRYVGFLRNIDELELLPGVAEAVRKINESGYLAIVVTNQPVIARGEVTVSQLEEIHNKLETLLGQEGAYVDAIYYCPHHPHKGYEGEVPELKIDCQCRKPNAGMLLKAAEDFHIDLTASYMVGDSESDVQCGINGGCTPVLLTEDNADVLHYPDLLSFVEDKLCEVK
ncbi:MAG: HAD-IIIA family hydrolase [Ruminococcaceae bacterium]|nr:HAD-IIIA family hydrolase [Oscillospiraceae bacterium]